MTPYITNLYTNISIKQTLGIIKTSLNKYTEQLIQILNQNYFRFNNKMYKQEDEIPVGSRTPNILSEMFL